MLAAMLDKTGTLQRATNNKDASGGAVPSWAASFTSVPCSVWPKGSGLESVFQRNDIVGTHVIATDTDYGCKANDRWLVGGVYYIVNGVEPFSNASVSAETLFVYDCTLRTV